MNNKDFDFLVSDLAGKNDLLKKELSGESILLGDYFSMKDDNSLILSGKFGFFTPGLIDAKTKQRAAITWANDPIFIFKKQDELEDQKLTNDFIKLWKKTGLRKILEKAENWALKNGNVFLELKPDIDDKVSFQLWHFGYEIKDLFTSEILGYELFREDRIKNASYRIYKEYNSIGKFKYKFKKFSSTPNKRWMRLSPLEFYKETKMKFPKTETFQENPFGKKAGIPVFQINYDETIMGKPKTPLAYCFADLLGIEIAWEQFQISNLYFNNQIYRETRGAKDSTSADIEIRKKLKSRVSTDVDGYSAGGMRNGELSIAEFNVQEKQMWMQIINYYSSKITEKLETKRTADERGKNQKSILEVEGDYDNQLIANNSISSLREEQLSKVISFILKILGRENVEFSIELQPMNIKAQMNLDETLRNNFKEQTISLQELIQKRDKVSPSTAKLKMEQMIQEKINNKQFFKENSKPKDIDNKNLNEQKQENNDEKKIEEQKKI